MKAFSLIEILVVLAIIFVLTLVAVWSFVSFQKQSDLGSASEQIINILRLAQSKTLASEGASQYGVYFENSSYALFKGSDFSSRDPSFDKVYQLADSLEIYDISLSASQAVFDRLTGLVDSPGNISLRLKKDNSQSKTIYIQASGQVGEEVPSVPVNSLVKDSRHVHFEYSRNISLSETLTLNFFTASQDIVIQDNIKSGQFYWEGEVEVDGEIQRIKIHTHRLNNPDTLFCVHRDARYNSKALNIGLSGDASPIIKYSADGLTSYDSIFTENLTWE